MEIKAKRPRRTKKKKCELEAIRNGSEREFCEFSTIYTRCQNHIVCIGSVAKGYLKFATHQEMDRSAVDVLLIPFYLGSIASSKADVEDLAVKCATSLVLGGYIVGSIIDGRSIINHQGVQCSTLSTQSMMISKSNRMAIAFGTTFQYQGETDLVLDYDSLLRLFEQARFREVQSRLVGLVRVFCWQLCCDPLTIIEFERGKVK